MGDSINKFLQGKKKYSVFIATFLTSVISFLVQDPQQAQELQEFVPLLAMLVSGVAYLIVEGWNDVHRAQAEEAYYNMLSATKQTSLPAESCPKPAAQAAGTGAVTVEPFDEAEFVRQVHAGAVGLAKAAFPDAPEALTSIYRAAEEVGKKLECTDIRQALAYWNYLRGLAEDAWKQLEFQSKDSQGCKLHPPELYEFRATVKRTATTLKNLDDLSQTSYDWRRLRGLWGATVYSVGALAGEALGR